MATMTTSPIIGKLKISDVPADLPLPLKNVLGVVTEFVLGEANANGNRRVSLTLEYSNPVTGNPSKTFLNWFIKDEFLSSEFATALKNGEVEPKTATSYRMNFQNTTRKFFLAVGLTDGVDVKGKPIPVIDFTQESIDQIIGKSILFSVRYKEDSFSKRGYKAEPNGFSPVR